MQTGTYKTTDPNVRIRVVFDEGYPTDNPAFPYAEGVLEDLRKCYDDYDYFGVIVESRSRKTLDELTEIVLENEALGTWRERIEYAILLGRAGHPTDTDWEQHDSMWSCAGYGDKVAEEVAKEYFGITVTGRE